MNTARPDATSRTRKPRISNNPPPTSEATAIAQPSGAKGKPTLLMYAVVDPKAATLPRPLTRSSRPISMRPTSGRNLVISMFDSLRDVYLVIKAFLGASSGDHSLNEVFRKNSEPVLDPTVSRE